MKNKIINDMKKGTLIAKTLVLWIVTAIYMGTIGVPGVLLYYVSKLARIVGFYLMLSPCSARDELSGFWTINRSLGDMFAKK